MNVILSIIAYLIAMLSGLIVINLLLQGFIIEALIISGVTLLHSIVVFREINT